MIKIDNISFAYEKNQKTLQNIDMYVEKGECILLCGESGCGKTTITKLINGLIPHFTEKGIVEGDTYIEGKKVSTTKMYEIAEYVGSVFQNPKTQFFAVDADSELVFGLENAGVSPEKMKERVEKTIEALDIKGLLGRSVFSMSAGEKQSLAFASVYAMNPDIFVLDEPTANLDKKAIDILKTQLLKAKEEGKTIIIAEHRLYFLQDIVDRAIYLKNGEIVKSYTKEEFWNIAEEKRLQMGLRSLQYTPVNVPHVKEEKEKKGLVVENLTCAIEKKVIFENLNFSVQEGEVLGVIGENGAGKTTLSRCLCGLIKEKKGKIYLNKKALGSKQRNSLSFGVLQDVNHQLFSDSVWNECELSMENVKHDIIEEVLKAFDLLEYKDKHPMALSGGQKQRLAVVTAVLSEKKILIFDEPTSGLDYKRMIEVAKIISKLKKQRKIMIIISHDFEFLEETCDKVFDMKRYTRKK